jgi:hypothetical protein
MTYADFIASKLSNVAQSGIDVPCDDYNMMPHQRDLTR